MPVSPFWSQLAYYGLIYAVLLLILVVGYPLAQDYAQPIAAFIFPINKHNSLLKNVLVFTGMYWGMVIVYAVFFARRGKPPSDPPQ